MPRLAQDLYQKIRNIRKSGARGTIELIGHSIGAHVAGQTGRLLKRYAGFQLDQIIGKTIAKHFRSYRKVKFVFGRPRSGWYLFQRPQRLRIAKWRCEKSGRPSHQHKHLRLWVTNWTQ